MGQFFKVLGNLAFGVLFAMMFFLWTFANTQTFAQKKSYNMQDWFSQLELLLQ